EGQEWAGTSECLIRMGRTHEAAGPLDQAKGLIPGNPYLLRAVAWEALSRGDRTAALACLDQGILDPRHDAPEIQTELRELRDRISTGAVPSSGHPSTLTQE
ncbi:MAG TPA: hypothetical protein VFT46_01045, partial [Holophagaceae bacterium]|nr:hypothetical protein [Holophagaceae bacterium]